MRKLNRKHMMTVLMGVVLLTALSFVSPAMAEETTGAEDTVPVGQETILDQQKKQDTKDVRVLVMCGHGQGDVGAVGCNGAYQEYAYTRDFGKRIYEALQETDNIEADLYKTKYDMFQQMRATVRSVGSFSGNGNKRKQLLKAIGSNVRIPDLEEYDYALEIHFNATVPSGKDPRGNGVMKGCGIYVNSYKASSERKIDKKILKAMKRCGMKIWGGAGLFGSPDLLNAKAFNELGINYSLLETCFIDDKDDMKFYRKHRDEMAQAIADTISDYFD